MKIFIQSILLIVVVGLFAVMSDKLDRVENRQSTPIPLVVSRESGISDREFLAKMIKHHEEAIKLAETIIVPTDRPEIHEYAISLIANQTSEIVLMQKWQKEINDQ